MNLGDSEVQRFLRRSLTVQLATLSLKERPFMTPLWFIAHGGVLYITTGPRSRAGKNIAHHPEVALLFRGERRGESHRLLRMRGEAACHLGLPPWPVLLRIVAKYYAAPGALASELGNARKWHLRRLYYGQSKGGIGHLRVVPTEAEFLPQP